MTNYNLHNDCKKLSQRIYPKNRHIDTNGWSYKGAFSNHRSGFYSEIYTKGDKAILVFRGTQLTIKEKEEIKDGRSDINIGLGKLPHQMQDAERAYSETIKKYGKDNVILTGHSLGGSEAQILGAKYGAETVTFAAYGTKTLTGVEVNYTDNIFNYGNAQDGIFTKNIDGQIGKTIILNSNGPKDGVFKKEYDFHNPFPPHNIENFGDLSKGIEYKKEVFGDDKTPLFKIGVEYNDYIPDEILDTKNRVLYNGEINPNDLEENTPLYDLYINQIINNEKIPTKKELDKRTRIGELIYVEEYTRSD
jgi:hypothetical protein